MYVEALEMRRRALPEGHPKIALPLWNPSMTYKRAEQYEKALPVVGEAMQSRDLVGCPAA